MRGVRHTNILGTLTLAHRLRRAARLQRFLYVSTAYLCGDIRKAVVSEGDSPQIDRRHIVEYTSSKAECEMLLTNTAPELPRCGPTFGRRRTHAIRLPAVGKLVLVLSHRRPSPIHPFARYARIRGARRLRCRALVFLLLKPSLRHRCYHVSAGLSSCVTWHEIAAVFAQC